MTDKEVAQWMAQRGATPIVEKYNLVSDKMAKEIDRIDDLTYGDKKK